MGNVVPASPSVDAIHRFQALSAGQYWRSLVDIPQEGIAAETVLLIQSIRWVDDTPHTIIMRSHPSKMGQAFRRPTDNGYSIESYGTHRFLLDDFLRLFQFAPDHQEVRNAELAAVQGKINALQNELLQGQANPALLAAHVESELQRQAEESAAKNPPEDVSVPSEVSQVSSPSQATAIAALCADAELAQVATGSVANAIGFGITEAGIAAMKEAAGREHQIATIKAKWIEDKTGAIAQTIKQMTPFYEELAAAALAQTEDVRTYVAKLMEGIQSLDLYVGKDVVVETLRKGTSAPRDVPLTFVQRKLWADEELAVYFDVEEWFDFQRLSLFDKALCADDGLVRQLFPTERCVLIMGSTQRNIAYSDSAFANSMMNAKNRTAFLLIRDGENIHRVWSPVESHANATRLFPSKDDQDSIFRGIDGSDIKFHDVTFTDRLARHDSYALHFKRFLILACGLDHRLKLFGDFYDGPPTAAFVSIAFQEAHCRFLHDDDGAGLLPADNRFPPLMAWLKAKNAYLKSGSRVLCHWDSVMNSSTAPGAVKGSPGDDEYIYRPREQMGVAIGYLTGKAVCVDVGTIHRWTDREIDCKVNLSVFRQETWNDTQLGYLCLDAVTPEELDWYIHNRGSRRNHIFYIRFFKTALKFVLQERAREADTRVRLAQALADGGIASGGEADALVDRAVQAWRAAHRGAALPLHVVGATKDKAWTSLLDQMYGLARGTEFDLGRVEVFAREEGLEPLRVTLDGKARWIFYAAPKADERDDRAEPHVWVHRITLGLGKTKLLEKDRRWTLLPGSSAAESILHEWPEVDAWRNLKTGFKSLAEKKSVLAECNAFATRLERYTSGPSEERFQEALACWLNARYGGIRHSKYVVEPILCIPVGLIPRGELRPDLLCLTLHNPQAVIYRLAPNDTLRQLLEERFMRPYANKSYAQTSFRQSAESAPSWKFARVALDEPLSEDYLLAGSDRYVELEHRPKVNPLLSTWLSTWMKSKRDNSVLWLADEAQHPDGSLALDERLGIRLPDDYCPTTVDTVTVHSLQKNVEDPQAVYFHWLDLYPAESPDEPSSSAWLRDSRRNNLHEIGYGYGSSSSAVLSRAAALAMVSSAATKAGKKAVLASHLPGAFQPGKGVERWVLVPMDHPVAGETV